jgi:16S rRNA (guanine966-N2)-methyltransferase
MTIRIYGNRLIKTLAGQNTRPTTSKVREALFNIWQQEIYDCCWLDLCAGNGVMSAEALLRGAKEVIAIEKNPKACGIIKQNLENILQQEQAFKILKGDLLIFLKKLPPKTFDKIYFDPPYESNLYQPVLNLISQLKLLNDHGEIAVEYDPKLWKETEIKGLEISRYKNYGKTALIFYRYQVLTNLATENPT